MAILLLLSILSRSEGVAQKAEPVQGVPPHTYNMITYTYIVTYNSKTIHTKTHTQENKI